MVSFGYFIISLSLRVGRVAPGELTTRPLAKFRLLYQYEAPMKRIRTRRTTNADQTRTNIKNKRNRRQAGRAGSKDMAKRSREPTKQKATQRTKPKPRHRVLLEARNSIAPGPQRGYMYRCNDAWSLFKPSGGVPFLTAIGGVSLDGAIFTTIGAERTALLRNPDI